MLIFFKNDSVTDYQEREITTAVHGGSKKRLSVIDIAGPRLSQSDITMLSTMRRWDVGKKF